jgi:hypothetical protein
MRANFEIVLAPNDVSCAHQPAVPILSRVIAFWRSMLNHLCYVLSARARRTNTVLWVLTIHTHTPGNLLDLEDAQSSVSHSITLPAFGK